MSSYKKAFGTKIGSSHCFTNGQMVHVTLVKLFSAQVLRNKSTEKDGYNSVVVGYGSAKSKHTNKPQKIEFEKLNAEIPRFVKEVNTSTYAVDDNFLSLVDSVGQFVDVRSKVKGRGFTGTIFRWNFSMQPASHGCSVSHRAPGSTGNNQDPGRVFKGKKMAGHYGDKYVTVRNSEIMYYDPENSLIGIKGGIPGGNGSIVELTSAKSFAYKNSN